MNSLCPLMLRAAASLALLLVTPILLIRAQTYDSSAVRRLLLPPPGCAAPCFQGLQPGETTVSEAITFFRQQPAISFFVERSSPTRDVAMLGWRDRRTTFSGTLHFVSGTLIELTFSGLDLDQIWLALGEPDGTQMANEMLYVDNKRFIMRPTALMGFYAANGLRVTFGSTCADFWDQSAFVTMGEQVVPDQLNDAVPLAGQRQIVCEKERALQRAYHGG